MKLLGGLLGILVVVAIGAFIYLSVADIQVPQTTVTKSVPVQGS